MKNAFKIKKKYRVRHQILELLYKKLEDEPLHNTNLSKSKTDLKIISESLKLPADEIRKYHMAFHSFEKDHVQCTSMNNTSIIEITEAGVIALFDEFWIKEGKKDLHDSIYNITRWILPVFSFLLSLIAIIISIFK